MKSLIILTVGLLATGVAAAYSDFSLTAPAEIQSYIISIPELNMLQMILAGVAVILFVSFREYLTFIDRNGLESEKSAATETLSLLPDPPRQ